MTERPSGTVTFLFSGIEGSTRLLRGIGPARYSGELGQDQADAAWATGRTLSLQAAVDEARQV